MNKQYAKRYPLGISSILLATSLLMTNATTATAALNNAKLTNAQAQKQLVATAAGQWCFELPWMGLFCYDS